MAGWVKTISILHAVSMTFLVEDSERGTRADQFLANRLPELSRSRIQSLMKEGHALRDGIPVRPSELLRARDSIEWKPAEVTKPSDLAAEAMDLDILFEDEHLLVINKPAGIVVHPGAGNFTGTLASGLLHHCGSLSQVGGIERPGIVHRLDKETSGCLVVCKSDLAHRFIAFSFANRKVEKTYLAVTDKAPRIRYGVINAPITRDARHRKRMAIARSDEDGREAVTEYRTLGEGEGLALIECRPKTGRTHQIRVHLKKLGCPVTGDPEYGRRGKWTRHLLHAWKIAFAHPVDRRIMEFEAPLPGEFPAFCFDLCQET